MFGKNGHSPIDSSSPQVRGTCASDVHLLLFHRFIPAGAGNICPDRPPGPRASVHPRRCGEHGPKIPIMARPSGSSPQVRGTCVVSKRQRDLSQFIPAGAGNIMLVAMRLPGQPVHPRRCGEHHDHGADGYGLVGSSPQVRGTSTAVPTRRKLPRFIPAGAGNMTLADGESLTVTVHPRRCGEHLHGKGKQAMHDGSSPQVRGTFKRGSCDKSDGRFIPAGAGNIGASISAHSFVPVHPRRCGEHLRLDCFDNKLLGSSPQVRGTSLNAAADQDLRRFIPAGAGNIIEGFPGLMRQTVHPRRCGEHILALVNAQRGNGSSPQVRGTWEKYYRIGQRYRFIPAGAGNILIQRSTCFRTSVHPRRCGEHTDFSIDGDYDGGSSPQVRGTYAAGRRQTDVARFIPAGAGNICLRDGSIG